MKKPLQRVIGAFVLLILCIATGMVLSQDAAPITASGSGIALPLLEPLVDASGVDLTLETTVTGTTAGLEAFCAGATTIAAATRPLSPAEEEACQSNNIEFMELLVGHYILALIGNPADDFYTCIPAAGLNQVFAPAAGSQTTNWNQVTASSGEVFPDLTLSVAVVPDDNPAFALLDSIINGDGIRSDAIRGTGEAVINSVSGTPGALGVVDLQSALAAADKVKLVNIEPEGQTSGCVTPSSGTVEADIYPVANNLYFYINRAQAEVLAPFLAFFGTPDFVAAVEAAGFSAPMPPTIANNLQAISGEVSGRVFSREEVSYQIPPTLEGAVNVGGSGSQLQFYQNVSTGMTGQFPNFNVTFNMEGDIAGYRRLCNGELDIVVATSTMTEEQLAACTANNIGLFTQPMGTQAVVLLGHEGDNFSLCLTQEQIATIWGAAATDTIENWQAVGETFPDQAMTLFGIREGNYVTDILLQQTGAPVLPVRIDTEQSTDPLYRAAATANVPGALTYMTWTDYQRVLANAQARIQVVAVDGGSGCVQPSESTILDGTYPLTQSSQLVISQKALANEPVKAYVWSLFADSNFGGLTVNGLLGLDFNILPSLRETLMAEFEAATTAAATAETTPEPESTSEPGATSEPESTSEAEATSEPQATSEAPAATQEAAATEAAEATAEATEAGS